MKDTKKNVLIVGSGGREHALGWKLSQSNLVRKTFFAKGNGGTSQNINITPLQIDNLACFAEKYECLTVVGPEDPLCVGIVDSFVDKDLKIFGPTKKASLLESSKVFAKQFMNEKGILTPNFRTFVDPESAKDYVVRQKKKLVIKADGLAAGKGAIVCDNIEEALDAVDLIMVKNEFGIAGSKILIEDRLFGEEVSFIALCDGKTVVPLASSQDHKRLLDNDRGPNTGGMGSYSPAPIIDNELHQKIMKLIMEPVIQGMTDEGNPFKGFLYAGIIVERESRKPYVLEFNVRMGDPECQPIMMRMNSDLFEYLNAAVDERLDSMPPIQWKDQFAVCVVMAAKGYPGKYQKGKLIEGLDSNFNQDTMVFHAGTSRDAQNRILTDGGRVLSVTSLSFNASEAIKKAYSVVNKISWGNNDQYYRTDIARNALDRRLEI